MNRRDQNLEPDYVRRLGKHRRLSDTLLVEATLVALAVSLLVLLPAESSEAPVPPTAHAAHRVCTPAFLPGEDEREVPAVSARLAPPQPPCAAPPPAMRLVQETGHRNSAGPSALQ